MCSRQAGRGDGATPVPAGELFAPETLSPDGALDLLLLLAGAEESALHFG